MPYLPNILSIRRTTIVTAFALLIYSFSRNPEEAQTKLSIIGLTLQIPQSLLDFSLPVLCLIACLRYLYYSLIQPELPFFNRRILLGGNIPESFWDDKAFLSPYEIFNKTRSFFPHLPDHNIRIFSIENERIDPFIRPKRNHTKGDGTKVIVTLNNTSKIYPWVWWYSDVEYFWPVIFSVLSIIIFIISLF